MLAAALAGPAALLQALLEYRLIDDEVDLTAVGAALLAADTATRKSVLQVLATPTAPIMILEHHAARQPHPRHRCERREW